MTRLAHVIAAGPHRSHLNELVTSSPWPAQAVVQERAKGQLASLKLQPGDRVRLRLDDTRKPKRGKKLPGVAKDFAHLLHAYRWGHTYVVCLIEVNGQIIPWGMRLDLKKAWCPKGGQPFTKLTELAAEVIQAVASAELIPQGVEGVVLVESSSLCRTVVQAIPEGWFFVSRLTGNRHLTVAGQKRKAGR